jgi:hypothetical protein
VNANRSLHAELAAMSLDSRGEGSFAVLIHVCHSQSEIRRDRENASASPCPAVVSILFPSAQLRSILRW